MVLSKMLGIRAKAAFGLVLLTLFILLLGGVNYVALEKLQDNADLFATRLMPADAVVLNADRDLYQALVAQQERLMTEDSSQHEALLKDFNENADQAYERMQKFLALMAPFPQVMGPLSGFEGQFRSWRSQAEQVFVLMAKGDKAAADKQHHQQMASFSSLRELYNLGGELDEALAEELKLSSAEVAESRQAWTLGILAVALVAGLVLIYFGPKLIVDSVQAVHEKVEDISKGDGDLVSRIPVSSQDELGKLAGGLTACWISCKGWSGSCLAISAALRRALAVCARSRLRWGASATVSVSNWPRWSRLRVRSVVPSTRSPSMHNRPQIRRTLPSARRPKAWRCWIAMSR